MLDMYTRYLASVISFCSSIMTPDDSIVTVQGGFGAKVAAKATTATGTDGADGGCLK